MAGILTVNHALGARYNVFQIYNDSDNGLVFPDVASDVDANNMTVDLSSFQTAGGGAIQGTWRIVVQG